MQASSSSRQGEWQSLVSQYAPAPQSSSLQQSVGSGLQAQVSQPRSSSTWPNSHHTSQATGSQRGGGSQRGSGQPRSSIS
jgi:hypothetical protein